MSCIASIDFTSGILLFAKTEVDRDALVRQFLGHAPVRQYLAVVRGHLAPKEGTLVHYFRRQGMFQKLTTERDPEGARAEMRYSVERSLRGASLVRVTLVTGLQNQIRVQFSAIGHPVIGDGSIIRRKRRSGGLPVWHCTPAHLEFKRPRFKQNVTVDSELPADLRSLIKSLTPG